MEGGGEEDPGTSGISVDPMLLLLKQSWPDMGFSSSSALSIPDTGSLTFAFPGLDSIPAGGRGAPEDASPEIQLAGLLRSGSGLYCMGAT